MKSIIIKQDLVEKVMVLQKSVEIARGEALDICDGLLASKLSQYAELLAAQGNLQTAFNYLGTSSQVLCSCLFS